MNPETRWQIQQCEGPVSDFAELVAQRALDETGLAKVLAQIAHPTAHSDALTNGTAIRLIRDYLRDAMSDIYAEQHDDKSDRADIYDRLAEARSESVDDEIDRRKEEGGK